MFNTIGLARTSVIIPITSRDTRTDALVPAMASLVLEPIDPSKPGRQMKEKTIREAISKDLFGFNEFYVTDFLRVICQEYSAKGARLAFLLGYNYKGVTYPCELIFEYRGGRLKKRITSVAIAEKSKGWTINVRVNSKNPIWFEDLIDGINDIIAEPHPSIADDLHYPVLVSSDIFEFASSKVLGVDWYSATVIKGTFFAQSERKVTLMPNVH